MTSLVKLNKKKIKADKIRICSKRRKKTTKEPLLRSYFETEIFSVLPESLFCTIFSWYDATHAKFKLSTFSKKKKKN